MTSGYLPFVGNASNGVYIWGAQLNIGTTAKPYFPTTDRLNVPRLTYQNGGGGCPSLLLEKQSTNLVTYSEQFDNAAWVKGNSTITANTAISPDGTQNADLLVDDTVNTEHNISNIVSITSNAISTFSIYLKSGTQKYAMLRHYADNQQYYCVVVDLDSGTITKTQAGTSTNNTSSSITNVGNGWYRVTATCSYSTTSVYPILQMVNSATPSIGTYGQNTYLGNGTNSINVWGAQLEQSSYATSYIPTTSASATRVADAMSVNLSNTNMTFCAYLECEETPLGTTAGDWLSIENNGANLGRAYGYANLFGFADAYNLGELSGTKMLWKQESGTTAKIFRGGALVGTSTTGTYSNPFNRFIINGAFLDKPLRIKEFVFFDNNLTDAECIALTT
jgi:hypothetical protein